MKIEDFNEKTEQAVVQSTESFDIDVDAIINKKQLEMSEEGFWKDLFQGNEIITLIMRAHNRNLETAFATIATALQSGVSASKLNEQRISGKMLFYKDVVTMLGALETLSRAFKLAIQNPKNFDYTVFIKDMAKYGVVDNNLNELNPSKWSWKQFFINWLIGTPITAACNTIPVIGSIIGYILYMKINSAAGTGQIDTSYASLGYTEQNVKDILSRTNNLISDYNSINGTNFKSLIKDAQAGNENAKANAKFLSDGFKQFSNVLEEFAMYISMMAKRVTV